MLDFFMILLGIVVAESVAGYLLIWWGEGRVEDRQISHFYDISDKELFG